MRRLNKFIGLAAIAAVLNPLCCCFADAVAAMKVTEDPAHACCTQNPAQSTSEKAPNGCASDEGCPHDQKALQSAQGFDLPPVVFAQVPAAPVREAFDFGGVVRAVSVRWSQSVERPPGRHDPPVYLLTHSFLC